MVPQWAADHRPGNPLLLACTGHTVCQFKWAAGAAMVCIKPQCQPSVASPTRLQPFICNSAKLAGRLDLTGHTAAEPNLKMRLNLLLADASGASRYTLVAVKIRFRLTSSSNAFHGSCRAATLAGQNSAQAGERHMQALAWGDAPWRL